MPEIAILMLGKHNLSTYFNYKNTVQFSKKLQLPDQSPKLIVIQERKEFSSKTEYQQLDK